MSLSISLNYTNNLPTLLENKLSFGRYAKDGYHLESFYEADQGWDNLFTEHLAKQLAPHRAGATVIDIGAPSVGKSIPPSASEPIDYGTVPPTEVEE